MNNYILTGTYTKKIGETSETFEFNYKSDISISERISFVNNVVDLVVNENHYNYIVLETAFNYMVLETFTDIIVEDAVKSYDENSGFLLDNVAEFVKETNIISLMAIKNGLLDSLFDAVEKDIEYKTGVKNNTVVNIVDRLVSTIEKKIEGFDFTDIIETAKKFNSVNGEFTPEKILEAYKQTDMFINNKNNRIKTTKRNSKK